MNSPAQSVPTSGSLKSPRGFTLVEVMVAATISLLVLAVALPALVSGLALSLKSSSSNLVTNGVRLAAEHMADHIGSAVSVSLPGTDATGHAASVVYTVSVGLPGKIVASGSTATVPSYATSITVAVDGTCNPAAGDLVKIAGLNLGNGLVVSAVNDPRSTGAAPYPTDSANVVLSLNGSIASGTIGVASDVLAGQSVTLFRVCSYAVTADAAGNYGLVWTRGSSSQVVATGLMAASAAPFSLTADGRLAFDFVAENIRDAPVLLAGSNPSAYTRAGLHGQLVNKSENPFQLIAMAAIPLPAPANGPSTTNPVTPAVPSTSTTTSATTASPASTTTAATAASGTVPPVTTTGAAPVAGSTHSGKTPATTTTATSPGSTATTSSSSNTNGSASTYGSADF